MRPGRLLALIIAFALIIPGQRMLAHEGSDHNETPGPVVLPALARAEAVSNSFELVAVAGSDEIVLYLDRFSTNEPVPDANVIVETPQGSTQAQPASDGTYRLTAPWIARPGRYDLIATVTKGNDADVLALTLEIPPAVQSKTSAFVATGLRDGISSAYPGTVFAVVTAFILGGVAGLFFGRRWRAAE